MTLQNYMAKFMEADDELTVWDQDYDIEVYFYNYKDHADSEDWDSYLWHLASKLEVIEVRENGVIVNMSKLIEDNIPYLTDLFNYCNIDAIMNDIENILAGYVSEKWLCKFVYRLVAF